MEDFQNAFNDADVVFVTPVYPAGEEPIEGVDARLWSRACAPTAIAWSATVTDLDDLCRELRDLAAKDDMVICMGAGDITKWAAASPTASPTARASEMSAVATMPRCAAS